VLREIDHTQHGMCGDRHHPRTLQVNTILRLVDVRCDDLRALTVEDQPSGRPADQDAVLNLTPDPLPSTR
jgi:hypothetical protein